MKLECLKPLSLLLSVGLGALSLLAPLESQGKRKPQADTVVMAAVADPNAPHPGKVLLENRCSLCHVAPKPSDFTMYEWPSIIQSMGQKAALRPAESKQLTAYIESVLMGDPEPTDLNPPEASDKTQPTQD